MEKSPLPDCVWAQYHWRDQYLCGMHNVSSRQLESLIQLLWLTSVRWHLWPIISRLLHIVLSGRILSSSERWLIWAVVEVIWSHFIGILCGYINFLKDSIHVSQWKIVKIWSEWTQFAICDINNVFRSLQNLVDNNGCRSVGYCLSLSQNHCL